MAEQLTLGDAPVVDAGATVAQAAPESVTAARYWAVRRSEGLRFTRTGVVRSQPLGGTIDASNRRASKLLVYRVAESVLNPEQPGQEQAPVAPEQRYDPDGHRSDTFFCTGCGGLLRPCEVGRCGPCETGLAEVRP